MPTSQDKSTGTGFKTLPAQETPAFRIDDIPGRKTPTEEEKRLLAEYAACFRPHKVIPKDEHKYT